MSNTIIFTIGRMNPPTPGHMGLIKNLIERAIQFGENKVGIILSHSVDSEKNPLECKEKREFILSGMTDALKNQMKREGQFPPDKIDEIQVIIVCMDDPTPEEFGKHPILKSFNALFSQFGYEKPNAYLIVGQDRAIDYGWIQKSLGDKILSYQVEPLDRPEGAMSATEMRGYIKRGKYDTFMGKMKETGIRYGATNIPILKMFGIDYIHGDTSYDINDPNTMVGTYWYDPVKFMETLQK